VKKQQHAIIVSGYFNPIHKGHIEYFHQAKALGMFFLSSLTMITKGN
jgi:cytidyltransferase-like protein